MTNLTVSSWIPSMFTVRVQDEQGQWIVYNSMTGSVGVIPKEKETELLPVLRNGFEGTLNGDALELSRRGFIVPKGTDERRRATLLKQQRQSRRALHLILMPTEECNFRCVYCYESFARGQMLKSVREGVKNLAAKTIPHIERMDVSWFGGEPLEEIEVLEELSHFMLGICRAHKVPYNANITTNGYHLTPDNFKKLLSCEVRTIQVTVDGLPHQHNGLRVLKGGGKTFERIWENLRQVRKIEGKCQLRLRVNFNEETLKELDPLLSRIAREFKDDPRFSIFFRPVGNWGGPNDGQFSVCQETPGELATFETGRQAMRHGLSSGLVYSYMRPNGSVCYASQPSSFVIGADGTVYKCTVALNKDFNKVGRLLPSGEMEMDMDKHALWLTSDDSEDKTCQSCAFRPACQGAACPLIRIETGQRPCPPEKTRMRRALINVWEHFQKFGKPDLGGAYASVGGRD